ncbi:50S ribosomal protein L31 [Candidatus Peregrinibacteria bacterium CG10_big_fil_rev_8_21_14_0_10_36_19]|nr:MAG: 50S ribosomal protein L31 [Candidatus Peregrinibacteria bacterium CG10_big_fil_rev_8_21_14_0_10_36_19]
MKTGIHPQMNDVVYIDASSGAQFITQSTSKSDEKMKIGNKEYFVIKLDVTSDTHPFYTGKQMLLDTAGRVDKFRAKMEKAQKIKAAASSEESSEEEMTTV